MTLFHRMIPLAMIAVVSLSADTIQLRDGRRVEGTFVGGDTRQVRVMNADGNVQSYAITDIETISFKGATAAAASAPAAAPAPAPRPTLSRAAAAAAARPVPNPTSESRIVVPAGTVVTVRMIDGIDSDVASTGERFRASLDDPLQVGEQVVAPRGSDATVQLVRVEQSGKLTGRDEVAMELFDVTVNGKKYPVATSYAEVQSDSRGARTGKVVGGTAALGAIIGAIAGGGKGAAVGAVSGAGAGAAVQVLTKGQRVKIPAESRLDFTLKQALVVE